METEIFDLSMIWAMIIAFAVIMYVLMDGFDLGVGMLFPFAPDEDARDVMMNSVAPVWGSTRAAHPRQSAAPYGCSSKGMFKVTQSLPSGVSRGPNAYSW